MHDARGCRVSGATPVALEAFERALGAFQRLQGDAVAEAARARREAPGFVMAHLLFAYLHLCGRDPRGREPARAALACARALPANERERLHQAAIAAALEEDLERAGALHASLLAAYPRDALALQAAHTIDHLLGDASRLRARVAAALPAWSPADPGYSAVLAMLAFGQQECGQYRLAEDSARRALRLDPGGVRAHHAFAHVLEMQGRARRGVQWMGERSAHWKGAGPVATHLWWHLALYHLELGDPGHALVLYDRRIAAGPQPALSELIDAAALLWRLRLRGVDAGARWRALASRWAPHAADAYCAFNDMHAMLAFAGAGRDDLAQRLIAALRARLARGGTNHDMTRLVGLPACRGLRAFGRGDYRGALEILERLPAVARRIGGSHAQRDLIDLTLIESAVRSGNRVLAGALVAERMALRPASPPTRAFIARRSTPRPQAKEKCHASQPHYA